MAKTTSVDAFRNLLMGANKSAEMQFDSTLIALDVAADNLITLQALNAGRLPHIGAVDAQFVSEAVTHSPLYLGQGIWLNDSTKGNLSSAAALSRPAKPFEHHGEWVALLLTLSVIDDQPRIILSRLRDLLLANKADLLLNADAAALLALLTNEQIAQDKITLSAEFISGNEHGLHARPGAILVNVIKQFTSEITIANLDGSGKPANARSLMKLVALGVKKGHRLRFTACGDAQAALDEIGQAMTSGLGEGIA